MADETEREALARQDDYDRNRCRYCGGPRSVLDDRRRCLDCGSDTPAVALAMLVDPECWRLEYNHQQGMLTRRGNAVKAATRVLAAGYVSPSRHRAEVEAARGCVSGAAYDVLAERERQVAEEGWSAEHDDEHRWCEMAQAAACYALSGTPADEALYIHGRWKDIRDLFWPATWDRSWWRPTTPRRDLVKAAALIIAEIERLDRAAALTPPSGERNGD